MQPFPNSGIQRLSHVTENDVYDMTELTEVYDVKNILINTGRINPGFTSYMVRNT